ncbi:hypothetical protein GGTG_03092 [Gaeumannomyces tritici R3-111a-1]|uniref:Uncharacterized protein n=1 Tax=Gaeumannomyces tritici (strain R3-111a-1) TaxID=644352 RepID=J3NP86_GAET3|nr:hypothetical protein GGTG_03092 [Gaeumannomyces tritici R3-111a-1]EJT77989.1 hypothetical protein GGTG_03092 [Gaeumannomyces tritici R3-111a-1]
MPPPAWPPTAVSPVYFYYHLASRPRYGETPAEETCKEACKEACKGAVVRRTRDHAGQVIHGTWHLVSDGAISDR